jgi:hypothetical protein
MAHTAWLAAGRGSRLRAALSAPGAVRACAVARLTIAHWWLPMAKLHTTDDLSDGAPPGTVSPKAEAVDRPRRGPHGAQCTVLAHSVALPVTAGDWTTHGTMSMGSIHGPWCTCLTQSQVLNQSEEGGRRRSRAHRCGQQCRSSTVVKVPVLQVGEQLWDLVQLWKVCMGREVG